MFVQHQSTEPCLTRLEEARNDRALRFSDDSKTIGIGRHECDEVSHILSNPNAFM